MVLTYDAYNDTLEKAARKRIGGSKTEQRHEQDMKAMRKELEPLLTLKDILIKEGLLKEPVT